MAKIWWKVTNKMLLVAATIMDQIPIWKKDTITNKMVLKVIPIIVPFIAHFALFIACKVAVKGDWI